MQRITEGDESAFNDIYSSFRPGFISYARAALHLDFNDAVDLFQEVYTLFFVNVRKGKLTGLANSQVGAYLYTTGRFINSNRIRKKESRLCTAALTFPTKPKTVRRRIG